VRQQFPEFEIDTAIERVDFPRVQSWLTTSYWSPGVSLESVEKAARHSTTVIGVYANGDQVGYCRVVSDETTFAWLCDVFVDEKFRGRGVAKAMVRFALDLPYGAELRKWVLATKDAQSVYAECGFTPLEDPTRWMWKLVRQRPYADPTPVS
jgi:GNAT superfamily N-acetyltransferase